MVPDCYVRGGASVRPKTGAFVCFADPDKTAIEADVFWQYGDYRNVVPAHVYDTGESKFGSVVRLSDWDCRRTILKTQGGEQYVLLRGKSSTAQLQCAGCDIRTGPFAVEFIVGDFPNVEATHRTVGLVADLYLKRRTERSSGQWTVEAMRHRDALVAVDLQERGCKYQDIARFLYGHKLVDEEWTNPNRALKNKTIRNYKRGRRMINGGYRALLK